MRGRFRIPQGLNDRAAAFLSGLGMQVAREQYVTNFRAARTTLSMYNNGTVIMQCDDPMMAKLLKDYFETLPFDYSSYVSDTLDLTLPERWIGSDEAGKGDYFGPLVVAGVCLDNDTASLLFKRGVSDSKKLSVDQLIEFDEDIRAVLEPRSFEVIVMSPEKYNQLHAKMGNVLDILVWAHSRVIRNISERVNCRVAIVDKFASGSRAASMENAVPGVQVHQFTKGEREMAVASASVLASAQFNRSISALSEQHGIRLLKGAGNDVKMLALKLKAEKGEEFYRKVAKSDFTL